MIKSSYDSFDIFQLSCMQYHSYFNIRHFEFPPNFILYTLYMCSVGTIVYVSPIQLPVPDGALTESEIENVSREGNSLLPGKH